MLPRQQFSGLKESPFLSVVNQLTSTAQRHIAGG